MRVESVRSLKRELFEEGRSRDRLSVEQVLAFGVDRRLGRSADATSVRMPSGVSLGISLPRGKARAQGFRLAVRLQSGSPEARAYATYVAGRAAREVDLEVVGPVRGLDARRSKRDPVSPGLSIGLGGVVDAGTLGLFATGARGSFLVSCNHVIGPVAGATRGHVVVQPGPRDQGTEQDGLAAFAHAVALKAAGANTVDAAAAQLTGARRVDPTFGRVTMRGVVAADALIDLVQGRVWKLGRTTGKTQGTLSAVELDGLGVSLGGATYRFDGQLEIKETPTGQFALPGDSGAVVLSGDLAVGLLFAGAETFSYANPLAVALDLLKLVPM